MSGVFDFEPRHWLVTGATGFLGAPLVHQLLDGGHQVTVWVRNKAKAQDAFGSRVTIVTSLAQISNDTVFAGVINLAGEPIAAKRWTEARKQQLRSSRIDVTRHLVDKVAQLTHQPEVLLSGSAIGYYGVQGNEALNENAPSQPSFQSQLCRDWEVEAERAKGFGLRVVLLRTGVVLAEDGGALPKMLLPFKLFAGGPIGDGQHVFSWIHRGDWYRLLAHCMQDERMKGPVNFVAPQAVSNKEFAKAVGKQLGRPACLPTPALVFQLMLGEMAELITQGQRVVPQKALDSGFKFKHGLLASALADLLH
ncbi:MAG: TIGR01777 family oxidoreductase [Aquabacterium sp.]|nr:TIGR01777 family oxidoreductase [Aquabacterium sp.]